MRLVLGHMGCLAWAQAKITFVDTVLEMLQNKDAQLVPVCRQTLPVGVVVWT